MELIGATVVFSAAIIVAMNITAFPILAAGEKYGWAEKTTSLLIRIAQVPVAVAILTIAQTSYGIASIAIPAVLATYFISGKAKDKAEQTQT